MAVFIIFVISYVVVLNKLIGFKRYFMDDKFHDEHIEKEMIYYWDVDLESLGRAVDIGIMRASNFSKFIHATKVEDYQIDYVNQTSETLFEPKIPWNGEKLAEWDQAYKIWGFNSCLTEVLELFLYFLEQAWNIKEISSNPVRIKGGQRISEIFTDLSFEKNLEQWFKSGVSIAENEKEILRSLIEMRHLITHNASIVKPRKQLKENLKGIVVKWYNFKFIRITEGGKKLPLKKHSKESGNIGIIPKSTVKMEFEIGKMLQLSYKDIQEIIYTLQWIMLNFRKQVLDILQGKDPKEDPFEMKIHYNVSYEVRTD